MIGFLHAHSFFISIFIFEFFKNMSSTTEESKEQKLSAQSELRLDVDTGKTAFVKVTK